MRRKPFSLSSSQYCHVRTGLLCWTSDLKTVLFCFCSFLLLLCWVLIVAHSHGTSMSSNDPPSMRKWKTRCLLLWHTEQGWGIIGVSGWMDGKGVERPDWEVGGVRRMGEEEEAGRVGWVELLGESMSDCCWEPGLLLEATCLAGEKQRRRERSS